MIELMIIIVLISTVATAYWNFHIAKDRTRVDGSESARPDSAIARALNEIGFYVHMAQPERIGGESPLVIERKGGSDRIIIKQKGCCSEFYVDSGRNLIRKANSDYVTIAKDIVSLKATRLGAETVILTIVTGGGGNSDSAIKQTRSHSKVITSDAIFASNTRR